MPNQVEDLNKDLWIEVEIPAEELIGWYQKHPYSFVKRVINRLKQNRTEWQTLLSITLPERMNVEFFNRLNELDKKKLIASYLCCLFDKKINDSQIIKNVAKPFLSEQKYESCKHLPEILLYVIYSNNEDKIREIFYEDFPTKNHFRDLYASVNITPSAIPEISVKKLQREFAWLKKLKKIKREIKVWQVTETPEDWTIFFRISQRISSPVRLVSKNKFLTKADVKVFRIKKNFSKLEIYSSRQFPTMLSYITEILKKITGLDFSYSEEIISHPKIKAYSFISKIIRGQISNISLFEVSVSHMNYAQKSVTITLKSEGNHTLEESIADFESKNGNLQVEDCGHIKVNFSGKKVNIGIIKDIPNNKVIFSITSIGAKSHEQQRIRKEINSKVEK